MAGSTLPPTYAHLRTFFSRLADTMETALRGGDSLPAGPEPLEVSAGFPVWCGVMREAPAQFEAAVAMVMLLLGVEKPAADLGPGVHGRGPGGRALDAAAGDGLQDAEGR
jgi:hypothetical protein